MAGNSRKNVEEQINDWLETLQFNVDISKKQALTNRTNQDNFDNLKLVQDLYNQLDLIKRVKNGSVTIHGFDNRILTKKRQQEKEQSNKAFANIVVPKF